jgi:hypothetical protein
MNFRAAVTALALAIVGIALFGRSAADATTTNYTNKIINISFTITPSPVPAAYFMNRAVRTIRPHRDYTRAAVAPGQPIVLAQAVTKQQSAKVTITTKADPYATYLHLSTYELSETAVYGVNTYNCAFQVSAYFPDPWYVSDWVYGASSAGGGAYPTWNYPTVSNLAWQAETVTTSFKAYNNQGTPGESVFTGVKSQSKTICIDLQLTVPTNLAPGTYSTNIQYSLYVTT